MRTTLIIAIWFSLVSAACGQRMYFGVVGGTSVTSSFIPVDITSPADAFGNPANRFQYLSGPRSLILGASMEGRLSERLAIEAQVLHRPMKSTITFTDFPADGVSRTKTNHYTSVRAWEFPLLLKYTLPSWRPAGRFRPFVEAGPSFRTQEDALATEPSRFGVSAGAGAAFSLGRIRIAPTLRYTRWARESIYPRYATKPDQIEFLTSVAYETDSGSRRVAGRRLDLGAVAGLSLTRGFRATRYVTITERTDYLGGLTAEVNATSDVSVEVDAIYKLLRAEGSNGRGLFSVVTWQFPVLAKYTWAGARLKPFAEAGPSFRLAGNLNGYNPSHYGITAGGGVRTRAHGMWLSPALRFTRWAKDKYRYGLPLGVQYDYSRTNPNALELLFGVSF